MKQRIRIWSIGASDSCAGAGLQADLAVGHACGVDVGVLTMAVTAQSSHGVKALQLSTLSMCEAQWQALLDDGLPAVIRLGWLPAEQTLLNWLVAKLEGYAGRVIWDPVMSATRGGLPERMDPRSIWQPLLRRCDVITPNRQEACWLAGLPVDASVDDILCGLRAAGSGHILLTGTSSVTSMGKQTKAVAGNEEGVDAWQQDCFFPAPEDRAHLPADELPGPDLLPAFRLQHPRIAREVHGTGCHLAAHLACSLALGYTLYDAVVRAVAGARQAIRLASGRASGYHNAWAGDPDASIAADWPWVLGYEQESGIAFSRCERPLGLYALTDNIEHLHALIDAGVDTLQWRVKSPQPDHIALTRQAIELCRRAEVPLYINDDWALAVHLNAYGVHLGQEDLNQADLTAIARAGLRLGISTHSDWEIARARALRPSYIAFGPVFIPLSKKLRYQPLGVDCVAGWSQRFSEYTLTCIGGITEHNIASLNNTAMASAAVVTALAPGPDLAQRVLRLRKLLPALEMYKPGPIFENC
jgi:hydroxymethylpyrimidine kinase/phosphomethylpyrimidine kinase/thiamine-phosphate diphosphorylase